MILAYGQKCDKCKSQKEKNLDGSRGIRVFDTCLIVNYSVIEWSSIQSFP